MKRIRLIYGNAKTWCFNILPTLHLVGFGSGTFLFVGWLFFALRILISKNHSFSLRTNYFYITPTIEYHKSQYDKVLKLGWFIWHKELHWGCDDIAYWRYMCDLYCYEDENNKAE